LFFPARSRCQTRDILTLFRGKVLRSGFATPKAASAPFALRQLFGFADRILSFACRNVYYELCKLIRVAGSFGHVPSMPHVGR
jgi:hypothetical protein